MTRTRRAIIPAVALSAALSATSLLTGCAGDLNPVRDVFVGVGAGATPDPAPDFIEQSRTTAPTDYVPVRPLPTRPTQAKTAEEIAELEAELEALRERQSARAASARRLSLAPPPEPVVVEPLPEIDGEIAPPPL